MSAPRFIEHEIRQLQNRLNPFRKQPSIHPSICPSGTSIGNCNCARGTLGIAETKWILHHLMLSFSIAKNILISSVCYRANERCIIRFESFFPNFFIFISCFSIKFQTVNRIHMRFPHLQHFERHFPFSCI